MINRFALSFLCIELDRNEICEVMLLYILLTGTHDQRWNLREFTIFSCQLQVSSARASHFLNAETCEFPSSVT